MRRDLLQRLEKIKASRGITARTKIIINQFILNGANEGGSIVNYEKAIEKLTDVERDFILQYINDCIKYVEDNLEPAQLALLNSQTE
jgi:hypothetical protein